ncbi:MAG: hypothetical protein M3072_13055 [Candidatus Dormibacteraeota bacterium]|nr:hypothetical protein [Candidatus Dormibacteraeota bacterium]
MPNAPSQRLHFLPEASHLGGVTVAQTAIVLPRPHSANRLATPIYRIGSAVAIVLGPLAVFAVRATVPSVSPGSGRAAVAASATSSGAQTFELIAGVVATVFLPIGVAALARLGLRGAPLLAVIGGALALVGWSMVPALVAQDVLTYELSRSPLSIAQAGAVWDAFNNDGAFTAMTLVFVIGHELGTLLLAAALWRASVLPGWAAGLMMVGMLLHPVAVASGERLFDLVGFPLLLIGLVMAARRAFLSAPLEASSTLS